MAGRRSSRLAIAIPITISGKDARGREFKEDSRTININKQGAKISTAHQLALGAEVLIENRALRRRVKSYVVWVPDRRSPEGPSEVGIQLSEAENIWGIEFPPEDWQEGPPTGAGGQRLAPSAVPAPSKPTEVRTPPKAAPKPAGVGPPPAPPKPAIASAPAKAEVSKPAGAPTPTTPPPSLPSDQAPLAQFTQRLEATAALHSKLYEEKLAKITNQVGFQTQASLQEAANRLEEKMVRALEAQFGEFADRLQATRGEFEALLRKLQELQKTNKSELENAKRNIEQAGGQTLESAVQQLNKKVQDELATVSSNFVEQTRKRVQEEVPRAVDIFSKEASDRLAKLTKDYLAKVAPELETRQTQLAQQAKEQVSQLTQAATTDFGERLRNMSDDAALSLRSGLEKSLEKSSAELVHQSAQAFRDQAQKVLKSEAQTFQQQVEDTLEQLQGEIVKARMRTAKGFEDEAEKSGKIFDARIVKRLDEATSSFHQAADSALTRFQGDLQKNQEKMRVDWEKYRKRLEDESNTALDAFQGKLEKTVEKVGEKSAKQVFEQLQKTVDKLLEASAKDLQKHAEETRDLLTEELDSSAKSLAAQAKQQLAGVTQSAAASLTTQAQTNAEEFATYLRNSLREFQERSARELGSQFQTLSETGREAILKELQRESKDFGSQALSEVRNTVDQVVKEAIETVNKQVGAAAVVLKQLQKDAEEASGRAVAQIKSKIEEATEAANSLVNEQVGSSAVLLKEWEDQAKARLAGHSQEIEAVAKASVEPVENQIREVTEQALGQFHKESERWAEDFENRMGRAAQVLEDRNGEAIRTKLQKLAEGLVEDSAARLRQQAEENLELVSEQLKEKRDRAVNEAAELLRTTMAQMFASLQPSPKKNVEPEPSEPEEVKKRR